MTVAEKIKEVEFEIPGMPEFDEHLSKLLAFSACFAQWIDNEKRFAPTSKQVIAHRLLTALEGSLEKILWRESDWQFVCQLLEDTEIDLVPSLVAKVEGNEDKVIPPPPFLVRRYLGAILGAKPVDESESVTVESGGVVCNVTTHNQTSGVTAAVA